MSDTTEKKVTRRLLLSLGFREYVGKSYTYYQHSKFGIVEKGRFPTLKALMKNVREIGFNEGRKEGVKAAKEATRDRLVKMFGL